MFWAFGIEMVSLRFMVLWQIGTILFFFVLEPSFKLRARISQTIMLNLLFNLLLCNVFGFHIFNYVVKIVKGRFSDSVLQVVEQLVFFFIAHHARSCANKSNSNFVETIFTNLLSKWNLMHFLFII